MEKIEKIINIQYNFDWENGISITDMKKDLDNVEKLGATHINIDSYIQYNDPHISVGTYTIREETDEEYNIRMKYEEKMKSQQEARKLLEYNKLKLKYDK